MKNRLVICSTIFTILMFFISGCSPTIPTPLTPSLELDKQLTLQYYRGVYNTCIYAATNDKNPNPAEFCLNTLQFALENDWYNLTTWPPMPELTPLDGNTPVPTFSPGG